MRRRTHSEFIAKMNILHPELRVIGEYIDQRTKIEVQNKYGICTTLPRDLILGKKPTTQSAIDKTEYFRAQLKEKHPEIELIDSYVRSDTKVRIRNKYGIYLMSPRKLLQGRGARIDNAENKTNYCINKFKEIHGNKYDYSLMKYVNGKTKVKIICKNHGEFLQCPSNHLSGKACNECANELRGYSRSDFINMAKGRDCLIYLIKCVGSSEKFYKIGITTRSVSDRFRCRAIMPYDYELIDKIIGSAEYVYNKEKELHRLFRDYKYVPRINFAGMTECFSLTKYLLNNEKIL